LCNIGAAFLVLAAVVTGIHYCGSKADAR
jgi:hypothetical protein